MANHKSATKKLRRDMRRRAMNVARLSRVRTFVKRAEESLVPETVAKTGREAAVETLRVAQAELMRGVAKGVLHKKTAARKVSRLAQRLNQLGPELGIWGAVPTFENRLGTMSQDPFGGYKGNALQAFYQKFTPSYVIQVVQDAVNAVVYAKIDGQLSASTPRINDVWEWLRKKNEIIDHKDVNTARKSMENYFDPMDVPEEPLPGALHAKGAEQILKLLGLLIDRRA